MTTEEYLRRKYGPTAIGDAREEDEDPRDVAGLRRALARANPEVELEPPLSLPPLVEAGKAPRRALMAREMAPEVDPMAEEAEALERARGEDDDARFSAGITNASKKAASAISGGVYRPDYVKPELGAESAERQRQKDVHDYLLRTRAGQTNAMNAEAALRNATRERVAAPPRPAKEPDPLEIEERKARIAKMEADTAKALRPPPVKAAKEPKVAGPRPLPAGEAASLGELGTVGAMVDDLGKAWGDTSSMTAFVTKHLPGTDAMRYEDVKIATAQVVGTILEDGKLTDADMPKYLRLMPDASDSKPRAQAKMATIRRLIDLKRSGKLSGFKAAKFDVADFEAPPAQQPTPADAPTEMVLDGITYVLNPQTGKYAPKVR